MTNATHDVRAVRLPSPMRTALALLVSRTLGLEEDPATGDQPSGDRMIDALFGDTPSFGQLARCTTDDVRGAWVRAGVSPSRVTAPAELIELLRSVTPTTPVCRSCGEFPLSNVGGKISALSDGVTCPFCRADRATIVPMTLRMLAWTDGRLVEPDTSFDVRSRSHGGVPLTDDGIVAWADGWLHPVLERTLKEEGVAVRSLLAHMNLSKKALRSIDDARDLLHSPEDFGLADVRAIRDAVRAAKAFAEARETTNVPPPPVPAVRFGRPLADVPRITVAGRTYLIEGRIGRGAKSDVFRGFWEHAPTERAVLKVCRSLDDADLMEKEVGMLRAIAGSSVRAAEFFSRLLPQLVCAGDVVLDDGLPRPVTVIRDKNCFDWTLADVIAEYPDGVDPKAMVWMWNRVLMLMGWVHMNGLVHGALTPDHILINAYTHGATFLDWSYATRTGRGARITALIEGAEAYYPEEVAADAAPTPETDIAMSARSMIAALGGDPATGDMPSSVPGPLADVVRRHARYEEDGERRYADAHELLEHFGQVAKSVHGPRKFVPFFMPARP